MSQLQDSQKVQYIFTDGSSVNNGKKNCVAAWAVYVGPDSPYNASEIVRLRPSNQHAELEAINHALDVISRLTSFEAHEFCIVTDSMYSINCLTKWYKTWQRNGYRSSKGDAVKHAPLIRVMRSKIEALDATGVTLSFEHQRSHTPPKISHPNYHKWEGNFHADKLAKSALDYLFPLRHQDLATLDVRDVDIRPVAKVKKAKTKTCQSQVGLTRPSLQRLPKLPFPKSQWIDL